MSWFLKALLAIVLIVFAIDAKSWIGRVWGIAMDEPKSRWAEVVEGREALYAEAATAAAAQVAAAASVEPDKLVIGRWFAKEGDSVRQREQLCELIGTRYTLVIAAPCDGRLENVYGPPGLGVTNGTVLARVRPPATVDKPDVKPDLVEAKVARPDTEFESPIPMAVVPLAEDIDRRASAALEEAFLRNKWRVQARAAFLDAMATQDLRALVEDLWLKVGPTDLYQKQGVDRLVYGRVEAVRFPSDQRCEVALSIRGTRDDGELLFSAQATGVAGPEPHLGNWVGSHPWRAAGLALLAAWVALALFTRGKVVPYDERAREEAKDEQAVAAGRQVTQRLQDVLTDLRRHQTSASTRSLPAVANALAVQVDRIDQIRQRIESASRAQHRAAAATGMWPEFMLTDLASLVRYFPVTGNEDACLGAVQSIARAVDALRDTVHTKTNV